MSTMSQPFGGNQRIRPVSFAAPKAAPAATKKQQQPKSNLAKFASPARNQQPFNFQAQASQLYQEFLKNAPDANSGFHVTMSNQSDFCKAAVAFLKKKQQLEQDSKPSGVRVAFHYTKQQLLTAGIRKEGLQMKCSRGGAFGNGIYVSNNAQAFSQMGDVGMLVLILTGSQKKIKTGERQRHGPDSFVGNKKLGKFYEETMLVSNSQVLPLLHYPKQLQENDDSLWNMQMAIQKWADFQMPSPKGPLELTRFRDSDMDTMPWMELPPAPPKPSVRLIGLEYFNPSDSISNSNSVGATGPCPAGSMTVKESTRHACNGLGSKSLILTYDIPAGVQDQRHPNPGTAFRGGTCVSFLPDNKRGRALSQRLKKAFTCGQVFTIDAAGILRWNITPQKTALTGGGDAGYPANGFLGRTEHSLDALRIPK